MYFLSEKPMDYYKTVDTPPPPILFSYKYFNPIANRWEIGATFLNQYQRDRWVEQYVKVPFVLFSI